MYIKLVFVFLWNRFGGWSWTTMIDNSSSVYVCVCVLYDLIWRECQEYGIESYMFIFFISFRRARRIFTVFSVSSCTNEKNRLSFPRYIEMRAGCISIWFMRYFSNRYFHHFRGYRRNLIQFFFNLFFTTLDLLGEDTHTSRQIKRIEKFDTWMWKSVVWNGTDR